LRSNPKFWTTLSDEAKQVLVSSPEHRRSLDIAHNARQVSTQDMAEFKRHAQRTHQQAVEAARKAAKAHIEGKVEAVDLSKNELAALKPKTKPTSSEERVVQAILGEGVGAQLLPLVGGYFGLSGPVMNQLGGVVGAAAPALWSGAKGLGKRPVLPLAGALGGNALTR
jgi:hypothetical protein